MTNTNKIIRENAESVENQSEHEMFMEDAIADWGKYNLRYLQYHHPDKLDEFKKLGSKLMNGADDERKLLYTLMTCSEYRPCNRSLCLLCEIDKQETSATPAPNPRAAQPMNAPQVQSAALRKLLDGLKAS